MKINNLLLTLLFLTVINSSVFAQATTTSETATNSTLLDNATKARAAADAKNSNGVTQEIRTIGGGTKPTIDTKNLTDQEKQLSENYIHQGKANAIITEKCAGDMKTVCAGNEGNHKFLGMDPNMVKAVSQAYAMFSSLAGDSLGGITSKAAAAKKDAAANPQSEQPAKDTSGAGKKADSKEDDKVSDYCKYIPTVTEGVATAIQVAKSKELAADEVANGDTAQKDALLKAAKSHDSRAKMAQIQAAGWWGGAACYAVNAANPTGWAVDKNLVIKMGAATLLGAFYQSEVSANKEYADKTRAIANTLPGKGDCNPITDNLCYCSQPSTENDPTYCAQNLHKNTIAATSYRVACTTNTLKIDPNCTCEKTNTCFETYLEAQGQGALNLGLGYTNSPFKSIRSLARGELVGSTINTSSYDATSAIAKKGLRDAASQIGNIDGNLNKDQKAMADSMLARGIPANVATLMASGKPSQSALSAATAKMSGMGGGYQMAAVGPAKSNIVDFSGGNGLGYKGNTKNEGGGADDLLSKLKPGQKAATNSKILEFAQKADAAAKQNGQIRKGDTPLFEIISLRYRTSGRKLLEVDAN
ncbi:MAG: hypothetical protein H7177_05635 [Rhizobacter sp.]|nr:hypothetical protein [Bacteriovorax sp.]